MTGGRGGWRERSQTEVQCVIWQINHKDFRYSEKEKSMATTLPRINFKEPIQVDKARAELALAANEKLGYSQLAKAIAMPTEFLFKLRLLDIQPFVSSKVEAYKKSKERTGMYSGTRNCLLSLATFVLCIGAFVTGMVGGGPGSPSSVVWSPLHYGFNAIVFVCILIALVATFRTFVIDELWGSGNRKTLRWIRTSLQRYEGCIPEFVLSKALQIKTAVPEVRFEIEQLIQQEEHKPAQPRPDPFLIVSLGNESYYIEVWDEKKYESTL
jgi:hypothetical protein